MVETLRAAVMFAAVLLLATLVVAGVFALMPDPETVARKHGTDPSEVLMRIPRCGALETSVWFSM